ncbi:hypothetical protein JCM5350_007575 [Sporobolomyces pararoseus]
MSSASASASTAPQTFEAALERINHLEEQLALAHRLFHQHSVGHQNLSDYLSRSTEASPSPPYRSVSQPSSSNDDSSESPSPLLKGKGVDKPPTQIASGGGAVNGSKPAPVDIGAFVLRALALRKNLTIGVVDPLEAEAEFKKIVGGSGLNTKQIAQVREWSGLQ